MDHDLGGLAFSIAISARHHCTGNQAMAVVAQGVAHVAQFAGGIDLAVKTHISVGVGCVGVVAALVALEVATFAVVTAVFAYKT